MEGAAAVEPALLSGVGSLTDWSIYQTESRWNGKPVWAVEHKLCGSQCHFLLCLDGMLVRRRFACTSCKCDVPDAVVFILQSMDVWEGMRVYYQKQGYLYAAWILEHQRKRRERYLHEFFCSVGIDPL